MIEYGADVTASDKAGITALHATVTEGRTLGIITLLVSNGASVDAVTTTLRATPLHSACGLNPVTPYPMDSVEMIERLLQVGATIEARDEAQRTPLMDASFSGKDKSVSYLLDVGANIEAEDKTGMTALHHAAVFGMIYIATLLFERSANKEAEDQYGRTPLYHAADTKYSSTVALLLEKGANPDATDQYR